MRFVCDSCRAQYMISDEKVGAKGVKVRCKKCGFVILVRRADAAAPAKPAARAADEGSETQVMDNPLLSPSATLPENPEVTNPGSPMPEAPAGRGGDKNDKNVFGGVDDDEIGAVFDQVLNSGQHKVPSDSNGSKDQAALGSEQDDRMNTRVIDADMVKKLAAESEEQKPVEDKAPEKPKADVAHDWFVAIDEKQTGPLTVEKIKDYWNRGEIGPDSLCWRSGFGDWLALSEVPELAAVLAPKPAKPVIVAPSPVANVASVVSVPVESAFSAGGMTKTVRSEMQVPMSASAGEDTSGWKPSAASALASLAKADIEALTKPKPKPAPVVEPAAALEDLLDKASSAGSKSLLDLPAAEDKPHSNGKTNGAAHAKERPVLHEESIEQPRQRPAAPAYQQPGATYTSPGFSTYKPQSKKGLFIGLGVGAGIVVLSLITAIVYFATKQPQYPPPYYPPQGQQQPPQVAVNTNPVLANPPPVAPVNPQVANPVVPANPQPVPGTQVAVAAANPGVPANPAAVPAAPLVGKTEGTAVTQTGPGVGRPKNTKLGTVGKTVREPPTPAPTKTVAAADPPPSRGSAPEPSGDDFDKEFGNSSSKGSEPKAAEPKTGKTGGKSVYIPPAPGAADSAMPDSLGKSDIMQVVLSNRAALVRCGEEQKKKDPGTSGSLVMRWTIQTNGKTSGVSCRSDEYKSTYMAACVGGLIKGWVFPRHKTQGDPVDFPFKF